MQNQDEIIYLDIAGFAIKICFRKAENGFFQKKLKEDVKEKYMGFIMKKPNKIDFSLEILEKKHVISIVRKEIEFFMYLRKVGPKKIESYYHASLSQIDLILKKILFVLLRRKGFVLHASASKVDDKAYIFTGKSTAGKSTAMKLLHPRYPSLADDSMIVKKENGKFYAYQTPFIEKESWIKKGRGRYEIGRIFFLHKTPYFAMKKLTDKESIVRKVSSQFLLESPEMIKQANILFEFVSQLDIWYVLFFKKDENKIKSLIQQSLR